MWFSILVPSLCTLLMVPAAVSADQLHGALQRMDESAAKFRNMSAKIKRASHTAVLKETTEESGSILLKKSNQREMRVLIDFTNPDQKAVWFHDRKVEIYNPKIKTVQIYDFGKQGSLVDQFLLLGFGTSGKELAKSYDLKALGEETVAGQKATRLELMPKSKQVRDNFNKFELWIGDAGHPVQQKLFQPSGDYNLVTYTDIKINTGLSDDALALKLPKDVIKEYPQR